MARRPLGFTVWFSGISGSGKTTLAYLVATELKSLGYENVEVLDEELAEKRLGKDLIPSQERGESLTQKLGYLADLLSKNGTMVFVAAKASKRAFRNEVRRRHHAPFFLVYVDQSPYEIFNSQYKQLNDLTEIKNFIYQIRLDYHDYEKPLKPEIYLPIKKVGIEMSVKMVLKKIENLLKINHQNYNEKSEGSIRKNEDYTRKKGNLLVE